MNNKNEIHKPPNNHHLRDLRSHKFQPVELTADFRQFCETAVLPLLQLDGYKLADKRELAMQACQQLVATGLTTACVADDRNQRLKGVALRVSVWDAIVAAKLATVCIGSESSGTTTRYRATSKLLALQELWELKMFEEITLARNTGQNVPVALALVLVHTGTVNPATGELLPDGERKKPISLREYVAQNAERDRYGKPYPEAITNGMAYFRAVEDEIERINQNNTRHGWQAFCKDPETGRRHVFEINVALRQIHVGQPWRAARLYSWGPMSGQNLSQAQRKTILIDGQPSAELDYSGMATRMLYHFANEEPQGDIYKPEQIFPKVCGMANLSQAKATVVRDFIKRATNIAWNVSSRGKANSAVGLLLEEHPQAEYLRKVLKLEGTKPTEIMDRIEAAHPALAKRFYSEFGMELMTTDGKIMLHSLATLTDAEIPALAIHDSLVCKATDAAKVEAAMRGNYQKFMRFPPVIKRVF